MKKLKLSKETVRVLTGSDLVLVAGGYYTGGDETVGHPGCESTSCPGSGWCTHGCTNSCRNPTCTDPWPPPPN